MIELENKKIKVIISPEMGMALMSFSVLGREILNQDLKTDFIKMRKGLGPIIVPHFNQASPVPYENVKLDDEKYMIFPHIQHLQQLGILHPFQHGIGRYVKWNYQVDNNQIIGQLSGDDHINNIALKEFTGFNFNSKIIYQLFLDYLSIKIIIKGELPVASGIHFYYDTVNENSTILLSAYKNQDKIKLITLNKDHNDILKPVVDKDGITVVHLKTGHYSLTTRFLSAGKPENIFNSLIIFNNVEKRFVCIEPISYDIETKNNKTNHLGEIQLFPESTGLS